MGGGRTAQWRVNMPNLVVPLTVDWDFGGGAVPNTLETTTQFDTSAIEVRMVNGLIRGLSSYRLSVVVSTVIYTVGPTNVPPDTPLASYDPASHLLSISVHDENGDRLRVSVTAPEGLLAEPAEVLVPGGEGEAVFICSAADPAAGGGGTAAITVEDGHGGEAEASVEITVEPGVAEVPPEESAELPQPAGEGV
jgi:hypothetical protein